MLPWATAAKRRPKALLKSQADRYSPERKEDISRPAASAARDCASLRAWKKQRCGWPARRGVRHWRPSAKVKEHKPERSFLGLAVTAERSFSSVTAERDFLGVTVERSFSWAAAERSTERLVDMEVSRKAGF